MAYKTEEMIEMCMKAIEENGLMFIDEIIAFVPFTSKTFVDENPLVWEIKNTGSEIRV